MGYNYFSSFLFCYLIYFMKKKSVRTLFHFWIVIKGKIWIINMYTLERSIVICKAIGIVGIWNEITPTQKFRLEFNLMAVKKLYTVFQHDSNSPFLFIVWRWGLSHARCHVSWRGEAVHSTERAPLCQLMRPNATTSTAAAEHGWKLSDLQHCAVKFEVNTGSDVLLLVRASHQVVPIDKIN